MEAAVADNMDFLSAIRKGKSAGLSLSKIARKIYLTYPTHAFVGEEERQYVIVDSIADFFSVPINAVQVAGSAKTGHSFHKSSVFVPGCSDLDVAIIDSGLYSKYMERVCAITRGYKDRSKFPVSQKSSTVDTYLSYLSRGIFRPDLMPMGRERSNIMDFFGLLSSRHGDLFSSINAAIYLSQGFFEVKQRSAISKFLEKEAL
jgi:hypothetical protein